MPTETSGNGQTSLDRGPSRTESYTSIDRESTKSSPFTSLVSLNRRFTRTSLNRTPEDSGRVSGGGSRESPVSLTRQKSVHSSQGGFPNPDIKSSTSEPLNETSTEIPNMGSSRHASQASLEGGSIKSFQIGPFREESLEREGARQPPYTSQVSLQRRSTKSSMNASRPTSQNSLKRQSTKSSLDNSSGQSALVRRLSGTPTSEASQKKQNVYGSQSNSVSPATRAALRQRTQDSIHSTNSTARLEGQVSKSTLTQSSPTISNLNRQNTNGSRDRFGRHRNLERQTPNSRPAGSSRASVERQNTKGSLCGAGSSPTDGKFSKSSLDNSAGQSGVMRQAAGGSQNDASPESGLQGRTRTMSQQGSPVESLSTALVGSHRGPEASLQRQMTKASLNSASRPSSQVGLYQRSSESDHQSDGVVFEKRGSSASMTMQSSHGVSSRTESVKMTSERTPTQGSLDIRGSRASLGRQNTWGSVGMPTREGSLYYQTTNSSLYTSPGAMETEGVSGCLGNSTSQTGTPEDRRAGSLEGRLVRGSSLSGLVITLIFVKI